MFYVKNHENKDNELTIFFKGEISSLTSPEVEKEALSIITNEKFDSLVLNFEDVTYISSAGLRVVLRFKQTYKNVSIKDASLSVYDVLQMTGFTNIMSVSKALRNIDVTGCEIIGEGYFSTVYRIDKDTIVKVYKNNTSISEVERELNMAKQAFVLGIPTAISFDIVKVGDKLGVRFEMLDSVSLRDLFRDYPERFDELIQKYAKLLLTINNTEAVSVVLPDAKQKWLNKLEEIKEDLPLDKYSKLKGMLEAIPSRNTFVHGDCHFKNIMSQGGELLLIDMDTLSKGHPIFELASGTFIPYVAFEEDDHNNSERFFGVSKELTQRIYEELTKAYLGRDDEDLKNKIKIVGYIHLLRWNRQNEPENTYRFNNVKERLLALTEKYDDLDIGI